MRTFLNRRTFVAGSAVLAGGSVLGGAGLHPKVLAMAQPARASFLVVGDWGRDGGSNQREVAIAMGRRAEEIGARFVVTTGDNFYEDGVKSVDDPLWRTSFEDIYTAPSLHRPSHAPLALRPGDRAG